LKKIRSKGNENSPDAGDILLAIKPKDTAEQREIAPQNITTIALYLQYSTPKRGNVTHHLEEHL
jgi:hypothetical protein